MVDVTTKIDNIEMTMQDIEVGGSIGAAICTRCALIHLAAVVTQKPHIVPLPHGIGVVLTMNKAATLAFAHRLIQLAGGVN